MWEAMASEVERFRRGNLSLGKLVADLRGLFVEACPHEPAVRSEFEAMWSEIDGENDLRTQPWAPPGSASDARLDRSLSEFVKWVRGVVMADSSDEHR